MKIIECEQGTEDWLKARLGIPTSSCFDKIVSNVKGDKSKSAKTYMYALVAERLSGAFSENFKSDFMERGNEFEEEACDSYQFETGCIVTKVGFCLDESGLFGASPDRLVGDDGLLEIKCPIMSTQIGYLDSGFPTANYNAQVQGQLLVTGRKWCDFIAYHPNLKSLIVRVERDEAYIAGLKFELEMFCAELDKLTEKIR